MKEVCSYNGKWLTLQKWEIYVWAVTHGGACDYLLLYTKIKNNIPVHPEKSVCQSRVELFSPTSCCLPREMFVCFVARTFQLYNMK